MISGLVLITISACSFVLWTVQFINKGNRNWNAIKFFYILAISAYSASMFASSFIEKESYTWCYITQTIGMLLVLHRYFFLDCIKNIYLPHMLFFVINKKKSLSLSNQTINEKRYPIALGISQLILVRVTIAWSEGAIALLSYTGVKWHLMALALLTAFLCSVRSMYKIDQKHTIDVNQMVKIVQSVVKITLGLIIALSSIFVLVYKMRTENGSDIPKFYRPFLSWELVQPLNQAQLGKLIYNYQGAGLFVLLGLFYLIKRASFMMICEANNSGIK